VRRLETVNSKHFGTLRYERGSVIRFPFGLPAFEDETEFLPVEDSVAGAVVFLQSLHSPGLLFITLPVQVVEPSYRLTLLPEELEALEFPSDAAPRIGRDVLCLVIVTMLPGKPPTANLMAPIVVNVKNNRAVQAIQIDSGYHHQHPLADPAGGEKAC